MSAATAIIGPSAVQTIANGNLSVPLANMIECALMKIDPDLSMRVTGVVRLGAPGRLCVSVDWSWEPDGQAYNGN